MTILGFVLLAFQLPDDNDNKPKVKKKTLKSYSYTNSISELTSHVEEEFNIHGQMTTFSKYDATQAGESSLQSVKVYKYDHLRHLVGTMVYDKNNILLWSEEKTWDDYDQVIKIKRTVYSPTADETFKTFEYDDDGNITTSQAFNGSDENSELVSEKKRTYNNDGFLLTASDWNYVVQDNKRVKQTTQIENLYNTKGQITKSILSTNDGKHRTKDIKAFQNGYMIAWNKYENGKIISRYKHLKPDTTAVEKQYELPPPIQDYRPKLEYDDAKRDPLANIAHTPFRTMTVKTDKNGNIIKTVIREYGQVVSVIYSYYNELNLITRERQIDKINNTSLETNYQYDKHGSVVEASTYDGTDLVLQHQYNYEYYH
ncbi:MAG: hypothetical protein GY810_12940 [Aureispira sp.]|nr:hypothetical protein [Aureispira sp.]